MSAVTRPYAVISVPIAPTGQGDWFGCHWRFVEGAPAKTILLLADNAKVLAETECLLKHL